MPLAPTVDNYLLLLTSKLVDYDRRESAREARRGGRVNINRMGLLAEAAGRVKDAIPGLGSESSPEALSQLRRALARYFDPDFPPIKALIKLIDARPAALKYGSTTVPRKKTSRELESDIEQYLSKKTPG